MHRVMFTPLARVDIEQVYAWYEAQRAGMGDHFRDELDRVWRVLEQFPEAGPAVRGEIRRVLVHHFPYAIYYRVVADVIEVRACLDQRQDPRRVRRRAET
jgi:plasmid stabilization system protein ParE